MLAATGGENDLSTTIVGSLRPPSGANELIDRLLSSYLIFLVQSICYIIVVMYNYCCCVFPPLRMTGLDVVVYSYLHAILNNDLPSRELGKVVRQYENLLAFHQTMSEILATENQS